MKLYVKIGQNKVSLNIKADTRQQLAIKLGSYWFNVQGRVFHVNEVYAEAEAANTGPGAFVGGLIGLLGGPIGLLTGSLVGGAIGNSTDQDEAKKANRFNQSWV